MTQKLIPQVGDDVKLLKKPDGSMSQHYQLTVGNIYSVKDISGCCIITNTDDNDTAIYHRDRVAVVPKQPSPS